MLRRVRMLLVLGATCWVAPLGAEPSAGSAWNDEASGCPYARAAAEAEAARAGATTVTIETTVPEGSLLGGGGPPSAFLP